MARCENDSGTGGIVFRTIREVRNVIIHEKFKLDSRQVEQLCWKNNFDMHEGKARARVEIME